MISSTRRSSTNDGDLLYSSATPSHTRRPSWPLSFGFDSSFSIGNAQCASMSSIPFPSGQTANVRRPQRRGRESNELPQPWMFAPDHQVTGDDSEEVLYVASPPTPQFPPTITASPSLNGRKHPTRSGYPFADDSSNCIYTASPKSHPSYLPTRNVSFPPSPVPPPSQFQPSTPYSPGPAPWTGKSGPAAIYSTSNSTGCLFSSSGSSGALLSLNQANLMLLQKADPSPALSAGGGSRSRRSSHGRTSSLESISEEEEE